LCHKLLGDERLYAILLQVDEDLAAQARSHGCPRCGGRLDSARFPRKPRGAACELDPEYWKRLSLCCSVQGCRGRVTPPSVRFLGRKVYLAAVVVLIAALEDGATVRRVEALRARLGVSLTAATVLRWRRWWRETLPQTRFWRTVRGSFLPPVAVGGLPGSLLVRFAGDDDRSRLIALLRFLSPVTVPTGAGFAM